MIVALCDELIPAEVLPEVFLTRPAFAPMSETALLQVVETVKARWIAEPENETAVLYQQMNYVV